jgi:hypothetical protein
MYMWSSQGLRPMVIVYVPFVKGDNVSEDGIGDLCNTSERY